MKRIRGYVLVEAVVAGGALLLAVLAASVLIYQRGQDARLLYEERVAWEVAVGRLETMEGEEFAGLAEGRVDLPVRDLGWENLADARCAVEVRPAGDGVHRVVVEVTWRDSGGVARRVEARTLARVEP